MVRKSNSLTYGFGMALLACATLAGGACGSSSSSNDGGAKGGSGGSAGKGGSGGGLGGSTGSGGAGGIGTGGSGGAGGVIATVPCTPVVVATPLITDFSAGGTFGPFDGTSVSGTTFGFGTFDVDGGSGVNGDTTMGNWHIATGVSNYPGFVIDFTPTNCVIDASAFSGLQFTISGNAGPTGTINVSVSTSLDTAVTSGSGMPAGPADILAHNKCTFAQATQYNECVEPSKTIPVTATPTVVTIPWAQFVGGKPAATVDPKEIGPRIQFSPLWPPPASADAGAGYLIDITIDDVTFYPTGAGDGGGQ